MNLKCDILVSKFAVKFNLYHYTEAALARLAGCVKTQAVGRGQAVVEQGKASERVYWIEAGECSVSISASAATSASSPGAGVGLYKLNPVDIKA